jgi:predicted glycosyltransferase
MKKEIIKTVKNDYMGVLFFTKRLLRNHNSEFPIPEGVNKKIIYTIYINQRME